MGDVLSVSDLCAGYGRVSVLWNVNLTVREGEIVSIVGSNSAGKTTLLRTISGLLRPISGSIMLCGRPITGMTPAHIVRAGISQVPQGRQLFPGMSVAENLEMGAAYLPAARRHAAETLRWVLSLFPRLEERMHQMAGTMSGGEQQMLAIARALMARPRLLMVDEPSLGLAPNLVSLLFKVMETVNREGMSILLVEQNVRQSLRIAHRGYVLENGRMVMEGTGEALLENEHVRKAYLGI